MARAELSYRTCRYLADGPAKSDGCNIHVLIPLLLRQLNATMVNSISFECILHTSWLA